MEFRFQVHKAYPVFLCGYGRSLLLTGVILNIVVANDHQIAAAQFERYQLEILAGHDHNVIDGHGWAE